MGVERRGSAPMATSSGYRGPARVLVRMAASSGGGTSVGPPLWRPSGSTKGCAARTDARTGSSLGFKRRGSAPMASSSGPEKGKRLRCWLRGSCVRPGSRQRASFSALFSAPDCGETSGCSAGASCAGFESLWNAVARSLGRGGWSVKETKNQRHFAKAAAQGAWNGH